MVRRKPERRKNNQSSFLKSKEEKLNLDWILFPTSFLERQNGEDDLAFSSSQLLENEKSKIKDYWDEFIFPKSSQETERRIKSSGFKTMHIIKMNYFPVQKNC